MTERAKYWQRLVASWETSGLTQAEFCRRRGLKAVNFAWWKRRLSETTGRGGGGRQGGRGVRRKPSTEQGRTSFVEVALPDAGVAAGWSAKASTSDGPLMAGYEVTLPCGSSIRFPADFDADRASQLISAVARSC